MPTDFDAAVSVRFAEDLSYGDAAPLLDALSHTPIFRVVADRVAWSGPAGGGPEVGLILAAIGAAGGVTAAASFAKSFGEELGKDAYAHARAALATLLRRLADRRPDDRRAVVGLAIEVDGVRIYFGPVLAEASSDLWTEVRLRAAFRRAQPVLDEALSTLATAPDTRGPDLGREYWVTVETYD